MKFEIEVDTEKTGPSQISKNAIQLAKREREFTKAWVNLDETDKELVRVLAFQALMRLASSLDVWLPGSAFLSRDRLDVHFVVELDDTQRNMVLSTAVSEAITGLVGIHQLLGGADEGGHPGTAP